MEFINLSISLDLTLNFKWKLFWVLESKRHWEKRKHNKYMARYQFFSMHFYRCQPYALQLHVFVLCLNTNTMIFTQASWIFLLFSLYSIIFVCVFIYIVYFYIYYYLFILSNSLLLVILCCFILVSWLLFVRALVSELMCHCTFNEFNEWVSFCQSNVSVRQSCNYVEKVLYK